MAGTKEGGRRAAMTNKLRHGKDFYARIGAAGGKKGTTGGFAADRERARIAGRKGGMISRRRKMVEPKIVVMEENKTPQTAQEDFDLAA